MEAQKKNINQNKNVNNSKIIPKQLTNSHDKSNNNHSNNKKIKFQERNYNNIASKHYQQRQKV
jgi:hypothetical protein